MRVFLLVAFILASYFAQGNIDSLKLALKQDNLADSARIHYLSKLAGEYLRFDNDSTIKYAHRGIVLSEKTGNIHGKINALIDMAGAYEYKGIMDTATQLVLQAFRLSDSLDYYKGKSRCLGALVTLHLSIGKNDIALKYAKENLTLDLPKGNLWYLAIDYQALSSCYFDLKEYDSSTYYIKKAMTEYIKLDDSQGISQCLNSIGGDFHTAQNLDSAIFYYNLAIGRYREEKDTLGMLYPLLNLGQAFSELQQFEKALKIFLETLEMAKNKKHLELQLVAYEHLYSLYLKLEDYENSLKYHFHYVSIKDSLFNMENNRLITEMESKYESDKKDAALATEKALNERMVLEAAYEKQLKYLLYAGLLLTVIFALFIFNRLKVTRKQKSIIQEQKHLVDEANEELNQTNEELATQRDQIEKQRSELQHKNDNIAASITYAKRIQDAIMPSMEAMQSALGNGFVLYLPKDVVAGDFFWMEHIDDEVFFAAADCTGHGVPGAMVSVVCSNALTKTLLEEGITDTAKLLDRTRELVIERLAKSGETVKDGMDISFCKLNRKTHKLQWSGANNPLWILKKNGDELDAIKADKQPIGVYPRSTPFTKHELQLEKGDTIYVFTDGYQDQFGGEKGGKFMGGKLKKLLIANGTKPMDAQKEILINEFYSWKGTLEQVDDVCVIGVRI